MDIIIGHISGHDNIPFMPFEKFSIVSVAMFFFLSGCGLATSFARKERYLKRIPGKILFLLVVSMIYYLIKIVVQYITGRELGYIPQNIKQFVSIYYNTTNWYIWELIMLYIVFAIVYKLVKHRGCRVAIMFFVSATIGVLFLYNDFIMAWYYSILGFLIGILVAEYYDKIENGLHSIYGWLLIFALVLMGVIGHVLFAQDSFGAFLTRNMFCIACIFAIILVIRYIQIDNEISRFLTSISLEVYLYQSLWLDMTDGMACAIRMLYVMGATIAVSIMLHSINIRIKKLCNRIGKNYE